MPFLYFLLCTIISFAGIFLLRKLALQKQIFDTPDEYLKTHSQPIPFLGGIGMASAFYLMSIILILSGKISLSFFYLNTFLILYSTTGLLDDFKNISVNIRLTAEILISIVLFLIGIRINIFPYFIMLLFLFEKGLGLSLAKDVRC